MFFLILSTSKNLGPGTKSMGPLLGIVNIHHDLARWLTQTSSIFRLTNENLSSRQSPSGSSRQMYYINNISTFSKIIQVKLRNQKVSRICDKNIIFEFPLNLTSPKFEKKYFTLSDPHRDIILKHICHKFWHSFCKNLARTRRRGSRALRFLDFIRIIVSSSSLLLVRGPQQWPLWSIKPNWFKQTHSPYAWFKTISDARASRDT